MPKRLNVSVGKTFNLRSTNNQSALGTKHIKKFKFRGNWNTTEQDDKKHNIIGSTNTETNIGLRTDDRKRKMAGRNNSVKNKMVKLDPADEIQHQIDDQIRMREGAMKLMSACSTLNQALETSKNLLTINARILGLMSALQRKKKQHVLQEYNRQRTNSIPDFPEDACMGRVAISDMRIPLMWKDNVHFTGKTGDQSYYAFALIRCGDQVRDTPLYEITSADTDMYFDLAIVFEELPSDFKMDFEVYYTVITSNEAHGIRTPIRTSMNLRTPKKAIHFNAPKFCLAGHVQLTIDDVRTGIISKDLTMGGKGASGVAVLGDLDEFPIHPLELWGQICFQLAAQPKGMQGDVQRGCIDVEINSPVNSYYCILRQNFLHCWENKETTEQCKPVHSIKLSPGLKVIHRDTEEDMNSIQLARKDKSTIATLKFASSSDCFDWKCAIRKQMNNIVSWKNAFGEQMHIQEMKRNRLSIPSTASFYDQVKIEEVTNEANRKHSSTSNTHDINGDPNSTPSDSVFLNSDETSTTTTPTTPQSCTTALETSTTEHNSSIKEETPSEIVTPNSDSETEVGKTKTCEHVSNNTSETPAPCSTTEPSDQLNQPPLSSPTNPTALESQCLNLSDPDPNLSGPTQIPSDPTNIQPPQATPEAPPLESPTNPTNEIEAGSQAPVAEKTENDKPLTQDAVPDPADENTTNSNLTTNNACDDMDTIEKDSEEYSKEDGSMKEIVKTSSENENVNISTDDQRDNIEPSRGEENKPTDCTPSSPTEVANTAGDTTTITDNSELPTNSVENASTNETALVDDAAINVNKDSESVLKAEPEQLENTAVCDTGAVKDGTEKPPVENNISNNENKVSTDENKPSSDVNLAFSDENNENEASTDENKASIDENKALIEENKALIEENKALIEENEALTDENEALIEENKASIDENKALADENKPSADENESSSDEKSELPSLNTVTESGETDNVLNKNEITTTTDLKENSNNVPIDSPNNVLTEETTPPKETTTIESPPEDTTTIESSLKDDQGVITPDNAPVSDAVVAIGDSKKDNQQIDSGSKSEEDKSKEEAT